MAADSKSSESRALTTPSRQLALSTMASMRRRVWLTRDWARSRVRTLRVTWSARSEVDQRLERVWSESDLMTGRTSAEDLWRSERWLFRSMRWERVGSWLRSRVLW